MSSFSDLLSAGSGLVFGGPASNKLAAATVAIQAKATAAAQGFGEVLGKNLGPGVFNALSSGAAKSSSVENAKLVAAAANTDQGKQITLYVALAALVALYFLMKKVR
jgi:hypothetical protein